MAAITMHEMPNVSGYGQPGCAEIPLTKRRRQDARLDDLLKWLESRMLEPVTQQEAAARVMMSPAAFSRWFKRNMGCVFNRYLNEIRVAKVCADIARGKLAITEAAFNAGYHNVSNFNRRFLEVTGMRPSTFRSLARRGGMS